MIQQYGQCQIPILPVSNFQESVRYYTDVLGFEVAWIWDEDGYGAVTCGGIELHLDRQDVISPAAFYWFVHNADEVYSYYKSQGVDIVKDIETKPWGVREFTFRDLNGHMVRIAHNVEDHKG
ncbi:VOC family protein [Paenibacillus sp. H1-7]|uniref:bleomycin resistance protein n=1 Tax=Paenibacillus sp. H1-7 TaxID=2282849 RepID=UPI001EF90D61|nr:VOC family protein [Paenibacillus sp. H1-7]